MPGAVWWCVAWGRDLCHPHAACWCDGAGDGVVNADFDQQLMCMHCLARLFSSPSFSSPPCASTCPFPQQWRHYGVSAQRVLACMVSAAPERPVAGARCEQKMYAQPSLVTRARDDGCGGPASSALLQPFPRCIWQVGKMQNTLQAISWLIHPATGLPTRQAPNVEKNSTTSIRQLL